MRTIVSTSAIALAVLLGLSGSVPANGQTQSSQVQPDNTKINKRDQNPGEVTADQQKANAGDRALAAKIRSSVIADKSLSTYAHNVKIITQAGVVTIKGPVRSEAEVKSIMDKASAAAGGADKVVNQMSVKP
jgi:hyperosmotically inducible protein